MHTLLLIAEEPILVIEIPVIHPKRSFCIIAAADASAGTLSDSNATPSIRKSTATLIYARPVSLAKDLL